MIRLEFQNESYPYDIYHMVKAFYPAEELEQSINEEFSALVRIQKDGREIASVCPEEVAEFSGKKEKKQYVNVKVYRILSKLTGKELAWGILTGIRPTKIIMKGLEDGKTNEEIISSMKKVHMVTEKKARLGLEIAKREKELPPDWTIRMDTVCMWGFHFVRLPVSIVLLLLIRWHHTKNTWRTIWPLC